MFAAEQQSREPGWLKTQFAAASINLNILRKQAEQDAKQGYKDKTVAVADFCANLADPSCEISNETSQALLRSFSLLKLNHSKVSDEIRQAFALYSRNP